MKEKLLVIAILLASYLLPAQQLLLLDRFNGNGVVNDSTITVFSSDVNIYDLTQYFTMKNNTEVALSVNLRTRVNQMNDSTSDYFCFGVKCWPFEDTTDIPAVIPAGAEDYTFASHVTHVRRFDWPQPVLPPGLSSITYTVFDNTTFPEPVEASVTVIYHLSGLGVEEAGRRGSLGAGKMALVYPNPARDRVTVEAGKCKSGYYEVFLYNNLGMEVGHQRAFVEDNKFTVRLSGYKPGLYSGKLVTGQNEVINFRFNVAL